MGRGHLLEYSMADLHDDVTYEGWGKSSAAGHRECMGNSKRVLRRSVSLLCGKTDRLHVLLFATQRVGVFISESGGCIAARQVALIDWKGADGSADDVPHCAISGKRLRPLS